MFEMMITENGIKKQKINKVMLNDKVLKLLELNSTPQLVSAPSKV